MTSSPEADQRQFLLGRVARNTGFSTLSYIVGIAAGLILTPYLIHALGAERFGLWALIAAVGSYLGISDFGLRGTFVKFFAEYFATGDDDGIASMVFLGVYSYIVLGIGFTSISALLSNQIIELFHVPQWMQGEARFALVAMTANFFLSNALAVSADVLCGLQQYQKVSLVNLSTTMIYVASALICLRLRDDLVVLSIVNISATLISSAALWVLAWRYFDQRALFRLPQISRVRRALRLAGQLQGSRLAVMVNMEVDRIIVGGIAGLREVTSYEIANRVALLTRGIPLLFLGVLVPHFSTGFAKGEELSIRQGYRDAIRYLAILSLFFCGLVIAVGQPLMHAWVGETGRLAYGFLIMLSLSYVINNLTGPATSLLRASGTASLEFQYSLIGMIINICLTLLLIRPFGVIGVVVATVLGNSLASLYFLRLFHRKTVYGDAQTMFSAVLPCLMAAGAAGTACYVLASVVQQQMVERLVDARLAAFMATIAGSAAYTFLYVLLLVVTQAITNQEMRLIWGERGPLSRRKTNIDAS